MGWVQEVNRSQVHPEVSRSRNTLATHQQHMSNTLATQHEVNRSPVHYVHLEVTRSKVHECSANACPQAKKKT